MGPRSHRQAAQEGARTLISRRRDRLSNRSTETTVPPRGGGILAQVRARYSDFCPTLAAEYLPADGVIQYQTFLMG